MSVTNLARYGTIEAPDWAVRQRRMDARAARKAHAEDLQHYNEQVAADHQMVWFSEADFASLMKASKAGIGGPNSFWGLSTYKAVRKDGRVRISISPKTAREWSNWMRQPGVDAYGDALTRLDEIASRDKPDGKAVDIRLDAFQGILATLEGPGASTIPDASVAAAFLRQARVDRSMARVYVTPAQAARLAEVFVAAKVDRLLVCSLDRIAGRTEPRPV